MKIAVVDAQGGGIGKTIIERLRKELPEDTDIIALGTNAVATSLMMKSGANEGASGENAIVYNSARVDLIIGTIGIIAANSMLGELTPAVAKAIAESPAPKILIPLNKCNIEITGVENIPLPHHIDCAIKMVKGRIK